LTIEHAIARARPKPWGSIDLRTWSQASTSDGPIGELWFERPEPAAPETTLLLKLLFTNEPLSSQIRPDDAFARSIGLSTARPIEVGADGLKALLAYPGPNVNPDALRERGLTGASPGRHDGSRAPLVSTSLDHAMLKQPETLTWPL
jgi:hypothetical protein